MFEIKTMRKLLIEERKKNARLNSRLEKASADIEYISMMSDIELDETEESDYE